MTGKVATKRGVGRPVGSDRAANLAKIFEAALATFAERGYGGAHFADIGARAGFSRSALYQYFPNKKALYLALLQDIQQEHIDSVRGIMESQGNFAEKLEAILAIFVADHEFDFNRSTFLAAVPLERKRHSELAEDRDVENSVPGLLLEFFSNAIDDGLIAQDVSPEDLLLAFLGGLLGMSLFQHSTGLGSVQKANGAMLAMLNGTFLSTASKG